MMHYMLKVYSPIFLKAQQGAPMVVPLSESTLWTMTEAEGLDTAFMELSAEATSEATAAMSIQQDYDVREMTFTLSVKPLQHQEAWVFASRYLISDTPADLYCPEMPGVYMKGRIAGYSFSRYSDSVTMELSFQPVDRFWHGDMQVTLGGIPVPEINVLSDVPCYPDLLYEMNLVPDPLQGYWWSRLQVRFSVPTYTPSPYAEGVIEGADEELLDFDIEDLKIPSTAGFTSFSISAYDKKASLSWQQGGGPITTVDLTAYIDWKTSTWGWVLAPGTVSITPRGYWTNGSDSQYSDWPGMKGTLTIHPLWATWPKELYDHGDGFIFSPYLLPENIKEGVVVLGVKGELKAALPDYTGDYTVEISSQEEKLETAGTSLRDDLTIQVVDDNLTPENIKKGVSILDVEGTYGGDPYTGPTEVSPSLKKQTLPTAGKTVDTDITIEPISPIDPSGAGFQVDFAHPGEIKDEITDLDGGPALSLYINQPGWYTGGVKGKSRQAVIADSEKEKIIPGNIKNGVSILGVAGTYEGEAIEEYQGPYTVTPDTDPQALSTQGKKMTDDVEIGAISPINPLRGLEIYQRGADIMSTPPDFSIQTYRQKIQLSARPKSSGEGWYTRSFQSQEFRVGIDPEESAKIVPQNIARGITILGVTGSADTIPGGNFPYPFTTNVQGNIFRVEVNNSPMTTGSSTNVTMNAFAVDGFPVSILVYGEYPTTAFPTGTIYSMRIWINVDYSDFSSEPSVPIPQCVATLISSDGAMKWTATATMSTDTVSSHIHRFVSGIMEVGVQHEDGDVLSFQCLIPFYQR